MLYIPLILLHKYLCILHTHIAALFIKAKNHDKNPSFDQWMNELTNRGIVVL